MKNSKSNILRLIMNLPFVKVLNRNKSIHRKSAVSFIELNEPYVKNWGKTAEYLPEFGENHLATSLFQLEIERSKATAVA